MENCKECEKYAEELRNMQNMMDSRLAELERAKKDIKLLQRHMRIYRMLYSKIEQHIDEYNEIMNELI